MVQYLGMKQNQRGQMRRATHRRHIPKSLVRRVIGWSLVVLGLLGLALPVLPGLILFAIAIVLLGPHDPTLRRLAVWVRLVLRRWSQAKQRHVRRLGIFVRQWYCAQRLVLRGMLHRHEHGAQGWQTHLALLAAMLIGMAVSGGVFLAVLHQIP